MTPKLATSYFLLILIVTCSGCSRLYFFDGIVVDGDGKPIAGATITLHPHDWDRPSFGGTNGTSGEDGTFAATWGNAVGVDYFRMIVAQDGYREHSRLVEADEKNLKIVLERIPSTEISKPGTE